MHSTHSFILLMFYCFPLFIICFALALYIAKKNAKNKSETLIDFDESNDLEKMKQQNIREHVEMEYETKKMRHVYKESKYDIDSKNNGYDFDIELFKKWSRQIFGCIKLGTEEQLKIVENFMSEALYNKLINQVKVLEKDGLEFVTENLNIEKCNLYDYKKGISKEEIKILIIASMKEYVIKKDTDKVIQGTNKKTFRKKIIMTFTKKNTNDFEGLIHNCPNCGAKISQTEFGKCTYCNTLLIPIRYNWTLTKFETIH